MGRIDARLLDRLEQKLGVGRRRLNERISETAAKNRVERDTASLILALDNGISIERYSTIEQRAEMRMQPPGVNAHAVVAPAQPARLRAIRKPAIKRVGQNDSVFVVHGRDESLRQSMFGFLRAVGLKPLEWEKALLMAKGANPHISEVLDAAMARVQAVVVMFSPDDLAMLDPALRGKREPASECKLLGQPRSNVLFEAGLALGRHPDKTLIVQIGAVRGFSDIAGRHVVRLTNDHKKRTDFVNRLEKIGCKVDRQGTDWLSDGDFTPTSKG